jgi:hypothetical protein
VGEPTLKELLSEPIIMALMDADCVDAEELEATLGEQFIALRRKHRTRTLLWNLPLRPQSQSKYCCRS